MCRLVRRVSESRPEWVAPQCHLEATLGKCSVKLLSRLGVMRSVTHYSQMHIRSLSLHFMADITYEMRNSNKISPLAKLTLLFTCKMRLIRQI